MQATSAISRQKILESINSEDSKQELPDHSTKIESQLEEVANEAVITPKMERPEEKRDVKYVDNAKSHPDRNYQNPNTYEGMQNYNPLEQNAEEETLHQRHRDNPFESDFEREQKKGGDNYSIHQEKKKRNTM